MAEQKPNSQTLRVTCKWCKKVTVIHPENREPSRDLHTSDCQYFDNLETDNCSLNPPEYEDENIFQIEVLHSKRIPNIQVKDDDYALTVTGHQNINASCQHNEDLNPQVEKGNPLSCSQSDKTERSHELVGHHKTERGCPLSCPQSDETERNHEVTGHIQTERGSHLACHERAEKERNHEVTGHHKTKRGSPLSCPQSYEIEKSHEVTGHIQTERGSHLACPERAEKERNHEVTGHHKTKRGSPLSCPQRDEIERSHEVTGHHQTERGSPLSRPQSDERERSHNQAVLGMIFQRCTEDSDICTKLEASKLTSSKTVMKIGNLFHSKRYGEALKKFATEFGIPQRGDTVDFCPNPGEPPSDNSCKISVEKAIQKIFRDNRIKNADGQYEQYIESFYSFIEKKETDQNVPVQILLKEWLKPEMWTERCGFENGESPVLLMLPMRVLNFRLFTTSKLIDRNIKVYNSRYELLSFIIWKPYHVTCYFLTDDAIVYYNNEHEDQNCAQAVLKNGEEGFNFIDRMGGVLFACYRLLE